MQRSLRVVSRPVSFNEAHVRRFFALRYFYRGYWSIVCNFGSKGRNNILLCLINRDSL